jgi:hypothetical protein
MSPSRRAEGVCLVDRLRISLSAPEHQKPGSAQLQSAIYRRRDHRACDPLAPLPRSDVQLLFTVTMAAALAVTTLLLVTGSCGYRYRLGIDDFLLIGAAVVVDRLLGRRRTGGEDSQRQSEKEYVHSGIA